jgi:hypothetical protein
MTRDWTGSIYEREPLSPEQQLARAHRRAAERSPVRRAAHLLASAILNNVSRGADAIDDYEARVKAWKHVGGDWTPFSKSKDQSK